MRGIKQHLFLSRSRAFLWCLVAVLAFLAVDSLEIHSQWNSPPSQDFDIAWSMIAAGVEAVVLTVFFVESFARRAWHSTAQALRQASLRVGIVVTWFSFVLFFCHWANSMR